MVQPNNLKDFWRMRVFGVGSFCGVFVLVSIETILKSFWWAWDFLEVGSFWGFLGFLAQNMAKMPQNWLFLAIVAIETIYITLKINHLCS